MNFGGNSLTKVSRALISGKGMSESVTAIVTQAMQASLGNYRREAGTDLVRKLVELAHRDRAMSNGSNNSSERVAGNAGAATLVNWLASHFGHSESGVFDKPAVDAQKLSVLLGEGE